MVSKFVVSVSLTVVCLPLSAVFADLSQVPEHSEYVTCYWDDFESHAPDTYICGDWIVFETPPIGVQFNPIGTNPAGSLVDCTHAQSGTQSMSLAIPAPYSGTCWAFAYNKPFVPFDHWHFWQFEYDVYIPSSPGIPTLAFYVGNGTNADFAGCTGAAGGTWKLGNTVETPVDTGLAVPVDQWIHILFQIHPDATYSIWYTPQDGIKRLMYAGMPLNGRVGGSALDYTDGYDLRGLFGATNLDGSTYYIDNYKVQLIDPTPQGHPVIHPLSQPVVIDGVVDTAVEWADVKKVAYKPVGSKGNFNAVSGAAYLNGLASDTHVDVYMGYDKSFFYVAMVGNNITSHQTNMYNDGRCEVVFVYDCNDAMPANTRSYSFWAYAAGPTAADANSLGVYKITGYSSPGTANPLDYAALTAAGGLIKYTVSGTTMQTEMKIPFSYMPEFGGIQPGKKLNVQFNYVEQANGDHRATTNLTGDFYPGWNFNRAEESMVGVTFPVDGDFNYDCTVNLNDLKMLADNWLLSNPLTDLRGSDGKTNFLDYAAFSANWMYDGHCY
jgi:hypothetical protein